MSDYEVTDSDYDYDENEKILLNTARKGRDQESEEEVFAFDSSENEKDDFNDDIEDNEDDLPSSKAWGKRKKNYYDTDYVDEDFGGFQGKDAEDAEFEEQEARAIQERLMQELDEKDYMLDTFTRSSPTNEEKVEEKIETDISGLSERDKLVLFAKESPEFAGIVADYKEKMSECAKKLQPIIFLINNGIIPVSPMSKYIKTKYNLIVSYCTNILFYLLLKARHVSVQSHPVIQRLFHFRQLLKQLETVNSMVEPEINKILEKINSGEEIKIVGVNKTRKQTKLETLPQMKQENEESFKLEENEDTKTIRNGEKLIQEPHSSEEEDEENARRGITYQIAKNKGLTPYRKKEYRNPRVKHKMKYQKAKIRRKGQVREPRKEIQKYGGEISGIKIGISKSVKIK